MILLKLPLPPSINAAYANVLHVGRVKTRAYKQWLKDADIYLAMQRRSLVPASGPCEVIIRVPEAMRGDCSNRIKLAEDFLVSRMITGDDANNRKVTAERASHVEKGFCEIEVRVA